jgi:hypoxanthine-guanine phosphoribosyltransferase
MLLQHQCSDLELLTLLDVVDDELTVEMIHLMLEDTRHQSREICSILDVVDAAECGSDDVKPWD